MLRQLDGWERGLSEIGQMQTRQIRKQIQTTFQIGFVDLCATEVHCQRVANPRHIVVHTSSDEHTLAEVNVHLFQCSYEPA